MKILGSFVACSFASFASFVLAACSTSFEKMPEADVDAQQKATAQSLATRIQAGCRSGTPTELSPSEAVQEMRDAFTPQKQASACAGIKAEFGDYQSLDYAETWRSGSGAMKVYRFKGHFSKSSDLPEIRVVMDGPKLSGFWIKPWVDTLR